MKFIHIADVHLGVKPDKDKPWAEKRERHSWQAFAQVIKRAQEEKTDLLLIAGDLFHRQPLLAELKEVSYQLGKLTHTQVVMIAGNHDYLSPDSYYRTFVWPEHVHFLKKEEIEYIELPMIRTRVYGMSYWHREITEEKYRDIKVEEGSFINILLAHGGDEKHIPFRVNDFLKSPFQYVACGHIHKPMELLENRVVMAGALVPSDSNDVGAHGYFCGELSLDGGNVEFQPLKYCEYVPLNLKVNEDLTNGELEEFVRSRISQSPEYQIFKIMLNGLWDAAVPLDTKRLSEIDRVVQVVNLCHPDYDFERLKIQYENQLVGKFISAMEALPQNEVTKKALYYGMEALMEE